MKRISSTWFWYSGLLLLWVVGCSVRFTVQETAQQNSALEELPFTLESALHFRLHEMVYLHGKLPKLDKEIEVPHGVNPAKTYSVSSEFVYSPLAHLLPDTWSLTEKIRCLQIFWFCMGIPALAILIKQFTGSKWAGWVGGLLYSVSLASVIRSSGLEISRENFALPLLLIHMVFWFRSLSTDSRRVDLWFSGLFLAGAMMSWDLIQYYIALWVLGFGMLPILVSKLHIHKLRSEIWAVHIFILLVAGLCHPYLRAHAFPFSIGMLMLYAVLIHRMIFTSDRRHPVAWVNLCVLLAPIALGLLVAKSYASGYGHFGELLWAKIINLNQKPSDPTLLTYAQRIMWVPALHSADWRLTQILFPTSILLSLLGVALTAFLPTFKPTSCRVPLIVFYLVSLVLYVFFVRFQVFLIPFASLFMVMPIALLRERSALLSGICSLFILGAVGLEAANTLDGQWGRQNVYYEELEELTDFLDDKVAPLPVLGNFGVSASALAYGRCPILLHPKFETEEIRTRVREYGEVLFKSDELAFRDWADEQGAEIYIHSMGSYASIHIEYQMRYFVDAVEPTSDTAAWRFEKDASQLRYFQPIFANRKYHVYRIVTREREAEAVELSLVAAALERDGLFAEAYDAAQASLAKFPHEPLALKVADRTGVKISK